jgi:hypothetical protein
MEKKSEVEADPKRARALPPVKGDETATEQPRKRANREEQAKCVKCNKRLARRGMFVLYSEAYLS